MNKDYGTNEGAEEAAEELGKALERHGGTIRFKTPNCDPPPPPSEVKVDYEKKYNKLAMAVVQMLNYMDIEHGDIVVREYELNILESLIENDFGYLVHGKYSNIGDGE